MNIESLLKKNFICLSEKIGDRYDRVNAPLFRKDFNVSSFKNAKIYICGLGLYELFINGKKITKGKLAPYFSNPNHIIYYDSYDITDELINGDNAIGVILGSGWLNPIGGAEWGFTEADWRASERLSLVLTIDDELYLVSDESFFVKPSHITFNDMRCGEYRDYRLYNEKDYLYGNIDDTFTNALKTSSPKGDVTLCNTDPIVELEVRKPISIKPVDGGYIYDFGENLAGVPRFKIKGHKGQQISMWHCEALLDGCFYNKNTCSPRDDRFMSQKDMMICSGELDTFEPYFTYHGFRYIFLEGSEGIECSLEMVVLSSLSNKRGTFECSNDIINKIERMTINSDISNFFYYPTDCPQREKNGWTGDAALSAEQFMYSFDCANSLSIWLDNIRKAQREDGQIPGIVPTYKFGYDWGNGPNWDSALFEIVYNIYKFSGNKQVIIDNKNAMYKYLNINLNNRLNSDELINYGLGDWCEAGSTLEFIYSTPGEVTDTLKCIDMLDKSAILFNAIGDKEKITYCKTFSNKLRENFKKKWVKDNFVTCATQTAQAMAISLNIFDDLNMAEKKLVELIHSNNDLMKYGVIGNKYIYDVLTEYGDANLAIKLMIQDKFPSFNYWIKNNATSLWEAFNELEDNMLMRKDGGRVLSLNHHFWGTVSAFFYKYIAGIKVNPNLNNPNEISIKPYFFNDIDYVKCSYKNDNNEILFEVIKNNNELKVNIINNKGFKII